MNKIYRTYLIPLFFLSTPHLTIVGSSTQIVETKPFTAAKPKDLIPYTKAKIAERSESQARIDYLNYGLTHEPVTPSAKQQIPQSINIDEAIATAEQSMKTFKDALDKAKTEQAQAALLKQYETSKQRVEELQAQKKAQQKPETSLDLSLFQSPNLDPVITPTLSLNQSINNLTFENIQSKIDQPIESYILETTKYLQKINPQVTPEIINDITPIYTIALINDRSDMLGRITNVQPTEMSLTQDWDTNRLSSIQAIQAGLDAINRYPKINIDPSYFAPGKTMTDYVTQLRAQFPKVSDQILEQSAATILQATQSGQRHMIWGKNKILTPEEVAKNPDWPNTLNSDGNLVDLPTNQQKVYAMLDGIEKTLEQHEAGPTEISIVNQIARGVQTPITSIISLSKTALGKIAEKMAPEFISLVKEIQADPTNTTIQKMVPIIQDWLRSDTSAGTPLTKESKDQLSSLLETATGFKIDLNQSAVDIAQEITSAAVKTAADYLNQPADPQAQSIFDAIDQYLKPEAKDSVMQTIGNITDALEAIAYPQAKEIKTAQAARPKVEIDGHLKRVEVLNDTITQQMLKDIGAKVISPKEIKAPIKTTQTSSMTSYLSKSLYSAAQSIRNSPEKLNDFLKKCTSLLARLTGLSKQKTEKLNAQMEEKSQVIIADKSSWFYASDKEFATKFDLWMQNVTVGFFKTIGTQNPGDIKVATIPSVSDAPLQLTTNITFNSNTGQIKSAFVMYEEKSYKVNVKDLQPDQNGNYNFIIDLNEQQSSFNKEFAKLAKKNIDKIRPENSPIPVAENAANITSGIADLAQEKLQPTSAGTVSVTFNPKAQTGLIKQEITQEQIDKSSITATTQYDNQGKLALQEVKLEGKSDDRFSPIVILDKDGLDNVSKVSIVHYPFFVDNSIQQKIDPIVPKTKTIAYDQQTGKYIITAKFDTQPEQTIINSLNQLLAKGLDAGAISLKKAIFEAPVLQDMRQSNPIVNNLINAIQADAVSHYAVAVESMVIEYNPANASYTTTTTQFLSDGSQKIIVLHYPFEKSV